ncbi:MAG: PTS sugar transporter subunit IIC [Clostridia bacterium]|nr:PTS sugar transporter subunit IIC [Clostridia bacterium]
MTIKFLAKRWFIDAFTGMAQGLFCTLIAGTILAQFGGWILSAGTDAGIAVGTFVNSIANIAKMLMGAGIGVGIANQLKAPKLVMFTAAVAGLAGAFSDKIIAGTFAAAFAPGNPIGSYIVSLIAIEIGMLICGKTKLDIVVVPLSMMILTMLALYVAWPFIQLVNLLSQGIALATDIAPFAMGIIVAVVMGILLTLPTSSAAMWVAIATPILTSSTASPEVINAMYLAGGAATVGCACQMVGFAVQSFRENKWGGLIAQGLGTSMLQIPNLMRHPMIIVPPVIASAIAGPLSTVVFKLRCGAAGGGMGTSGLVGVFDTISASAGVIADWQIGVGIAVCMFIIPVVVCILVSEIFRKYNIIHYGDMQLDL